MMMVILSCSAGTDSGGQISCRPLHAIAARLDRAVLECTAVHRTRQRRSLSRAGAARSWALSCADCESCDIVCLCG